MSDEAVGIKNEECDLTTYSPMNQVLYDGPNNLIIISANHSIYLNHWIREDYYC